MIVLPSCSLCKGGQIDNPVAPCERDLGFGLKAWANIYCTDQPATEILSHISNSTGSTTVEDADDAVATGEKIPSNGAKGNSCRGSRIWRNLEIG